MKLTSYINTIPHIDTLVKLSRSRNRQVFIVGGVLRDWYLGQQRLPRDFDFCVHPDPFLFAKCFQKIVKGKLVVLDEWQKSYRVILKTDTNTLSYDFSKLRGKDVREDMMNRDFVINTLALPLDKLPRITVIDWLGARQDISRRIIRIVQEKVVVDDPLRILRAFSFMVRFGFALQKRSLSYFQKYKSLLSTVSPERINEELFKIFSGQHSYHAVKVMSEVHILDEIIPHIMPQRGVRQGTYHHLDVWSHALLTLQKLEALYRRKLMHDKDFKSYLDQTISSTRTMYQIIKLACLVHDMGKPPARKIKNNKTIFHCHEKIGSQMVDDFSERLRISLKEKELLKKLIFWHLRPGYLADQITPSRRAVYRFFRDLGECGPAVIILSIADWRATRGPATDEKKRTRHERVMFKLLNEYFLEKKKKPMVKLLNGHEIMKRFSLSSSPLIGRILEKIKEEQSLGAIRTKDEAYTCVQQMLESSFQAKN